MKKIVIMILVLIIFITAMINVSADIFYYDIYQHWAFDEIYKVTNKYKIFNGYEDSTFRPDNNITRSEFVKILYKIAEINGIMKNINSTALKFPDYSIEHWSYTYTEYLNSYLKQNNIRKVNIYNVFGEKFLPDSYITREEAVVLAASLCAPAPQIIGPGFSDISKNHKYYNEITKLYSNGIISGYSDNTFRGKNYISRAEASVIAAKLQKEINLYSIENFSSILLYNNINTFSLFGEYNDETDDDNNYFKAVSSLEYISFVGYIFPGDSYLYDSTPLNIFRQLRETGYKNLIGVNYYIVKYDENLNEKQKRDMCNEILYEIERYPDILSDEDFLIVLNEIVRHDIEYEILEKIIQKSISERTDVYSASDIMYNYWKYIFTNEKFEEIAIEVDYFMENRFSPQKIVENNFFSKFQYEANAENKSEASLYYVNMTNFAKLMHKIGLKTESIELLKTTYNVLQNNNDYRTFFNKKKDELTGNIKYAIIN